MQRPRAPFRYVSFAGAILCGVVLTATAWAGTTRATQRKAQRVQTYATRGTIPLRTAVFDPFTFVGSDYATAFAMTHAAGATYVRIIAYWSDIAPKAPYQGFDPSNPESPGYSWTFLDNVVASAEAAGLTPIVDVGGAPGWAAVTKNGKPTGTPKATALGEFATALATHYDGKHGAPPVHIFQVWNEPNLSLDLSPVSGAAYRGMVNAFADAVHAVDPRNLVVAGGLDPFGHPKSKKQTWYAQAPLAFMRSMLCVSMGNPKAKKASLRRPHRTCNKPAEFDVWSHHPYTFNGPLGKATRPDDVSLGNLPAMRKLLQTAVRLHQVRSAHKVQFWVTEFSWDTRPPRPHAAPMALAARWTAESLYQMWRAGVSLVTWFGFQDQKSPSPYQSGFYFYSKKLAKARAKPTLTAFRFPFVAYLGKRTVSVWGRDATSTKALVTIQQANRARGPWRTVARIRANRYGIFEAGLKLKATSKNWLRATAPGSGTSLPFSLTVPTKQRYGPWGN